MVEGVDSGVVVVLLPAAVIRGEVSSSAPLSKRPREGFGKLAIVFAGRNDKCRQEGQAGEEKARP